jgi:DNA-binding NtrC family response regulator
MKRKTVLFVDDDTRVLAALKRGLAEEPYEKLFASGGHEALDLLQRHGVQVMVSDPGQSRCPCEVANVSNAPVETHPMQTGEWER